MKKTKVTAKIHARLSSRDTSSGPSINALVRLTACVRGRIACATICTGLGRIVKGKNVPDKRNIGVINRNPG